ncbi:MAG TPA: hypothetical protein VF041_04045 [Gemmatimonadaceae bacterium]
MTQTRPLLAALAVGGLVLSLAACGGDMLTAPHAPSQPVLDRAVSATSSDLLACPASTSQSATAVIGPRGGTLSVGRFAIRIPEHAVAQPTTFVFDVPASPYLEVDIHAAGIAHYEFARRATVTLDYSRCGADLSGEFDAWYIDDSGTKLHRMHGHSEPGRQLFVFKTDHLSRYAIAD